MEGVPQKKKRSRRTNPTPTFKVYPEESGGPSNGREMLLNPSPGGHRRRRSTRRNKRTKASGQPMRLDSSPPPPPPPPALSPYPRETRESSFSMTNTVALVPVVDHNPGYHGVDPSPSPRVHSNISGHTTFRDHHIAPGARGADSASLNHAFPPDFSTWNPMVPPNFPLEARSNCTWDSQLGALCPTYNAIPYPNQSPYASPIPMARQNASGYLTTNYPGTGNGEVTQTYPFQPLNDDFMVSSTTGTTSEHFFEVVQSQQGSFTSQPEGHAPLQLSYGDFSNDTPHRSLVSNMDSTNMYYFNPL